jgi:hypothetical protein
MQDKKTEKKKKTLHVGDKLCALWVCSVSLLDCFRREMAVGLFGPFLST